MRRRLRSRTPRRLAFLTAAAVAAAPLIVVASPAAPSAADPLPSWPTTVTLAASASTLGSQDSATLTATAGGSVTGTGAYILIADRTSGTSWPVVAACGSGSTCSVNRTFNDLANVERTYVAYVGSYSLYAPPPNTAAVSNTVTVTPVSWSLSLTSTLTTLGSQDTATVTASVNQSINGTGKYMSIYRGSSLFATCTSGTTCSLTASFASLDNTARTFTAYVSNQPNNVGPPSGILVTSNTVTLTPVPWSLGLTSTMTTLGSQDVATLTASANQSVSGTGKAIWIRDTASSQHVARCDTGATCGVNVPFSTLANTAHTYVAYVGASSSSGMPPPGTVATSNTVTLTPVAWSVTLGATLTTIGSQDITTLTATANQSVTGTGKWLSIVDRSSWQRVAACSTGSTCSVTRSFGDVANGSRSYVAYVANDASSGVPPGAVATSNLVTLTPVPWSLTLTSSTTTVGTGAAATLTATANQGVGGTGKYILIFDKGTGAQVASCSTGTACSVTRSFADLNETAHTYVAYVSSSSYSAPPPGIVATSSEVTLTPVPWSVTLTHTGGWIDPSETITLTAQANQSVTNSGQAIQIYDATGYRIHICYYGVTCSVAWTTPQFPARRLVATIGHYSTTFPPPGMRAKSNVVMAPTTFAFETMMGAASLAASALDPVNVATGNYYDARSDIVFPSQVRGLAWTRTYNSRDRRVTTLGRGWSPAYSATATMNSLGEVEVRADDGRLLVFPPAAGGYASPTGFPGRLTRLADGTFRLDDYHGSSTSFGADGAVTRLDFPDGTYVEVTRSNGRASTVTSSLGYALSFAYSIDGRLTSVTASDGRVASFAYTGSNLTSVTAPDGRVTQYGYDSAGRVVTVTDAAGRVALTNTYDGLDRVVSQQTAPGQTVTLSYSDNAARTTAVTEPGATTVYTHDAFGRVTKIVDSLGKTATVTYGGTGYASGATNRLGAATGATTDARGNVTSRVLPSGTETYVYDSSDRLVSATDVRGSTTTFGYTGTWRIPTTVTHADGSVTTQTVSNGLVMSTSDADGVARSYTYDVARNLVAVTDDLGHTTTMAYDAAGRMTSRTTPLGFTTSWTYDAAGRVTSTTDAEGEVTSTTYDAAGNVATETDEAGHVTTYAYDAANQLLSETDATGAVTSYTYNARGEQLTESLPGGATTTYTYGALGRIATETGPLGEQTSYTYDADGRVTAVTDSLGGTVSTTYDDLGNVLTSTDALGRTTTFTRDAAGHVTSTADAAGAATARTYDTRGRVATDTDALGRITTYAYSPGGRLLSLTRSGAAVTAYGYDDAGRRTTETDPAGHVTTTAYDHDGRTTAVTSPEGLVTSYTYDAVGRVLTAAVPGRGTATTAYTLTGDVATRTDATGGVTAFGYDVVGRMTSATDPNGDVTTFGYDARGNRTSMTDARDNVWTWTYDLADRVTATTDPLAHATTYGYDVLGRPTTVTDAAGRVRTTTYDAAGQVTTTAFSDGSQVGYTYDGVGRVLTATDGTLTETTSYDAVGNLLSDSYAGRTMAYTYDARDRVATITHPDGSVATNAYDAGGRLTGVTRTGGGAATYTYDDDGRVLTETLPGSVTRAYQYTSGALAAYDETRSGTTTSTTLSRDAAGRVTGTTVAGAVTAYDYDDAGQLVGVDAPGTAADVTYAYDDTGNATSVVTGGATTTRTYDAAGRLVTSTAGGTVTTYTFDDSGRLVASDDGTASVANTYDAAGRLRVSARDAAVTTTSTRAYSPSGRLSGIATDVAGTVTTTDLSWVTARRIPQVAAITTAGVTTNVFYGVGKAFATTGAGGPETFSHDALGNLRATPGTAAVVRANDYTAFGAPDVAGDTPAFGYRGELHLGDDVHLRAREYAPGTQQFASRDPLDGHPGQPVVANPYHYAANDPINSADPTGLDPAITDESWYLAAPTAVVTKAAIDAEGACIVGAAKPQSRYLYGSAGDVSGSFCLKVLAAGAGSGVVVVGTYVALSETDEKSPKVSKKPKVETAPVPRPLPRTSTTTQPEDLARMRVQLQWKSKDKRFGEWNDGEPVTNSAEIGVTVSQVLAALELIEGRGEPAAARKAASGCFESAREYIQKIRSGGGIVGRSSWSCSFNLPKAGGTPRVDVENLAGHNLRT